MVNPSRHFPSSRGGVSELYASVMMVGVTLAVGGLVATSALGQFVLANDAASINATTLENSASIQLGLVYFEVASSTSCPIYGGYHEGTMVEVAIYDYGVAPFTPSQIILNGTVYAGNYASLLPGSLGTYAFTTETCLHSAGQTVVVVDSVGGEAQFGS